MDPPSYRGNVAAYKKPSPPDTKETARPGLSAPAFHDQPAASLVRADAPDHSAVFQDSEVLLYCPIGEAQLPAHLINRDSGICLNQSKDFLATFLGTPGEHHS